MKVKRAIRFAVVGSAGFCVDVVMVYCFLHLGWHYILARMLSFLMAVTVTWCGNRWLTFDAAPPQSWWREWATYATANSVGGIINLGVYGIWMLIPWERAAWAPLWGTAAGSAAALFFNYWAMSTLVFSQPTHNK